jgi:uroporphyrin-III C-methyltransferase / precorrin-2 dehydrogenase / sirohydrochlorin ferrochelatase
MIVERPSAVTAGRMRPLARLPVFLAIGGKRAIVAGGSAPAAWKAELLSAAGACVEVYAKETSEEMRALAADPPVGSIVLHARGWAADQFSGAAVAVGAFADDADAEMFVRAARNAGVPVNVIDKPALCDFAFGAIVNRSPLVIGISTDGAAPVFAQAIRAKLEALLPSAFAIWAAAAQSWRPAVVAAGLTAAARRNFWRLFARHAVIHAERAPAASDFNFLLTEIRGEGTAAQAGSVEFVHAGPGDPELLTLRAVRALQSADIILFDEFVSREVLDFARREARKLLIGTPASEGDINALIAGLVRSGKRVVRLTAGADAGSAREGAAGELAAVSSSAAANSCPSRSEAAT